MYFTHVSVQAHASMVASTGIQGSKLLPAYFTTVLGVWPKSPRSKMVTSTFQALEETKEQSNREKIVSAN